MTDISTKEKILKTAHKLFSEKGLSGVSVREIAKSCQVNIAAINYHFTNKENLYLETIRCSMLQTKDDMKQIYESLSVKSIHEFVQAVFEHFLKNSEDLRTAFKLIISSDRFAEAMGGDDINRFSGPPGGEYFALCLRSESPSATNEDIDWAVRVLFTQVIHKALMLCNESICGPLKNIGVDQKLIKGDIARLSQVVTYELKERRFRV